MTKQTAWTTAACVVAAFGLIACGDDGGHEHMHVDAANVPDATPDTADATESVADAATTLSDAATTLSDAASERADAADLPDAAATPDATGANFDAGPATGENCAGPLVLEAGTATYTFVAASVDHLSATLLSDAGCISAAVLSGPDIVFAYTAAASGTLSVNVLATTDFNGGLFRVAAVLTDDPCGSPVLDQAGTCDSAYSETPSVDVSVTVVAGNTYYLYVAKTDSSPNTFLNSQVTISVTES